MAVQAHYPSNALFLNRNLQESEKANQFTIQAQTEEAYPDQLHSSPTRIFNTNINQNENYNSNEQKLARNTSSALTTAPIDSFPYFLPQSQQPQHQNQQQISPNPICSFFSDHINHQINQQQHEIDQLLHFQGEQLQRILTEKRQQQYRSLLSAADESLKRQLSKKQSELEKALRRNAELEARAAHLSTQSQLWQAKARQHESTAASLQSQLHQALINRGLEDEVEQEKRSQVDDAESVYVDDDRVVVAERLRFGKVCKVCGRRPANVVVMPCRHLCVCAVCDGAGAVVACPGCFTMKNSSVEVFFP